MENRTVVVVLKISSQIKLVLLWSLSVSASVWGCGVSGASDSLVRTGDDDDDDDDDSDPGCPSSSGTI